MPMYVLHKNQQSQCMTVAIPKRFSKKIIVQYGKIIDKHAFLMHEEFVHIRSTAIHMKYLS